MGKLHAAGLGSPVSAPAPGQAAAERLAALRETGLLDARPDAAFDRLARLAAQVLRAPVALVSLMDVDRQVFVGAHGLVGWAAERREAPLAYSVCRPTLRDGAPLAVSDLRADPGLRDNPAIAEFSMVAYAGMPLRTSDGHVLGTLCVVDTHARQWTTEELEALRDLASATTAEIELRTLAKRLRDRERQLADLLDTTDDLVCAVGPDGRFAYANRAWRRTLGYGEDALVQLRPMDLVAPEHVARYLDAERALLHGESMAEYEMVLVAKDGSRHVVRGHAVPTMRGNVAVGARAVYRDVTRERRGEALGARLVATIEATTDLVAIATRDGHLVYLNRAGKALIGLPGALEPATLAMADILPDDALHHFLEEVIPRVLRRGVWEGELRIVGAGGEAIPVSAVVVAHPSMRDDDESPYFVSMIMRDLRGRVRDEARLRESESRFRRVLESVRMPAVVLDADARVTFANDYLCELTGWRREEFDGVPWFGRLVPEPPPGAPGAAAVARGEAPAHVETELLTRTGERRLVAWDGALLRDLDGAVAGMAYIGQDVTDRRRVEEMKDQVISVVGHELRSPIGAVRGALQVLGRRLPTEGQERELLDLAIRNSDRLLKLVSDLLDYERLSAGVVPLDPSLATSDELLEQSREVVASAAEAAGVTLALEGDTAELWVDPGRIVQVLVNLLGNAIKFSPAGGTVTASSTTADGEVTFRVRDEGRGIPADRLDAVFDRFTQVHASDARRGSGLGLAIARAIVRQHGGRIWVESAPGRGSTFSFTLPTATAALGDA